MTQVSGKRFDHVELTNRRLTAMAAVRRSDIGSSSGSRKHSPSQGQEYIELRHRRLIVSQYSFRSSLARNNICLRQRVAHVIRHYQAMSSATNPKPDYWSSQAYNSAASFVPLLTSTVVAYLDAQPSDAVLDIGCGLTSPLPPPFPLHHPLLYTLLLPVLLPLHPQLQKIRRFKRNPRVTSIWIP